MPRISQVYLCSVPELDINYNHTVNFKNRTNQFNWFYERVKHTIPDCSYLRKERAITVPFYIDDIMNCNYCIFNNEGKIEYFFIYQKEYKNDGATTLYIKLDVLQTYWFDLDFRTNKSLVERQHCNRYDAEGKVNTFNMLENENLEVGELIVKNIHTLYDYSNKGIYIVSASDRLGAITGGSSGGGSGSSTSSDKFYLKKMVGENGFVFIKSMESFASKPYDLGDGTLTIGYGTTSKYDSEHYNQLAPVCTEQQASEVMADSLYSKYSSYVYDTMVRYGKDMSTVKQNEFDAFVSFYYNHGNLTNRQIFIDYVNGVDKNTIYNKWLTTVIMEGSQFEEGLRNRRKAEADVFRDGIYKFKTITDISTGQTITENNGKGYIPERFKVTTGSELQNAIVNSARKLIGIPYVYGGNYPPLGTSSGTDCSGLCQWAYNDNGISISRTTYTQIKEGIEVNEAELQPGDLIFPRGQTDNGHVYLYSGKVDGKHMCVEAKQTGTLISEHSFTWDSSKFRARRII